MLMTKNLPLPQRYAGGYRYSDRLDGTLYVSGIPRVLPQEVVTSKGRPDFDTREAALAELAMAPVGALYTVRRECRPEEDEAYCEVSYRKTGLNEWQRLVP